MASDRPPKTPDPRSEDMVDREAKTPRTSNTFNIYASSAYEKAAELSQFAFLMRKRMLASATEKAQRAEDIETDLRELGARFGAWPSMSAETVAFEKFTLNLPGALLELREQANLLMASSGPPILKKPTSPPDQKK